MKILLYFFLILNVSALFAQETPLIEEIKIYKSKHLMELWVQGKVFKSYKVMLGRGGRNPKRQKGDLLVPEGKYQLDYKNPYSNFYKSIHISYPNEEDILRAQEMGVDPGGDIMIHGFPNKETALFKFLRKIGLSRLLDWTSGCVAITNSEMEEVFELIEVPTPITIYH